MFGRKKPQIRMTFEQCLAATIVRNPQVDSRDLPSGNVQLSLPYRKPWVVRWFSRSKTFLRRFELDSAGSELWQLIDDKRTVSDLAEHLVGRRGMPRQQAAESIVAYMHMLLVRGMVGLVVPEQQSDDP